ncbi:hypothetical protein GUJ93_ZPchr0010g9642 [Zizania palustris]|uniref:Uncharacterized protein n=1 Tax=Zizania palustris TaxID=103762 RepID=A0A8J6BHL6_ZIZPA|nr:hypothetical protein GUJ93_ZPchr0010g9642 [Zizania palustris]
MHSLCDITPATPDEESHNEALNSVVLSFNDSTNSDKADPTPQLLPPPVDKDDTKHKKDEYTHRAMIWEGQLQYAQRWWSVGRSRGWRTATMYRPVRSRPQEERQ